MNKKSLVASILNNIFSVIGFVVIGYISYVICAFGSLGLKIADTDAERISILLTLITVSLPALMCFVNFVMSVISYKFIGRGQERYKKGYMIALFIVEIVAFVSFVLFLILNRGETLMKLVSIGFTMIYAICAMLHIVDFIKSKKLLQIDKE